MSCEGRGVRGKSGCWESSRKTVAGVRVEMGLWRGQGRCVLVGSRGRHSHGLLVSTGGGDTWMASGYITEVGYTGLDGGSDVRLNEERGAKNDSWASGLSNRQERRKSAKRWRRCHFISERGPRAKGYFSGDCETTVATVTLQTQ